MPSYNEAASIAETIERLLNTDYPAHLRHILVISDASTDGTDDVVRAYADRGVELLRLPQRGGKTAAENAAGAAVRGAIVINTDASVRVHPAALRPLVAAFTDPLVGVASGRDVSTARAEATSSPGESAYVGYEMWVRDLETRVDGIVGASGCLFGVRTELHRLPLAEHLSRDFDAALVARRHGLRAVSVPDAICYVPQSTSLRKEYRRKVRTMARGLATL
ncbi:MAG: glycosyltransferase, partial [Gemmatimonadaceae bacterium]